MREGGREGDLLLSDKSEKNLFFQSYKGVVIRERFAFRERKKREHTSAYVSICQHTSLDTAICVRKLGYM